MRVTALVPLLFALLPSFAFAGKNPRVSYQTIDSEAEGRPMTYAVYTPPGWDGEEALPLVVFLHGGGDDHTVLDKHPIVPNTFDRWIEEGLLPPFILVAPDGKKSFWRNWADGSHRYADWVVDDVIPDAQARYGTHTGKEDTHLMGISMGGAGSLYLGLENLETFGSITVWSAPIFTPEESREFLDGRFVRRLADFERIFGDPTVEEIAQRNAFTNTEGPDALQGTSLMIGAGTVDIGKLLKATRHFHDHLTTEGIGHDFVVYKGGHRWVDWARVFPVALCRHMNGPTCTLPESRFYSLEHVAGSGGQTAGSVASQP